MDVIITPEAGQAKHIAQLLLGLADHPNQVKPVSWPSTGFQVSQKLFEEFETAMEEIAEAYGKDAEVNVPGDEPVDVTPVKRRGRPKKVVDTPDIAEVEEK